MTGCTTATMAAPLLASGLARFEAALDGYGTSPVCQFYAITTVFQLYHGSDMVYEMKRRKPELTLLPTQRIFNLPGKAWYDSNWSLMMM